MAKRYGGSSPDRLSFEPNFLSLSVSVPELLCPFKLLTPRLLGAQSSLRPGFLKGHTLLVQNGLAVYEHHALRVPHKNANRQVGAASSTSRCTRLVADAENNSILVSSILWISLPALSILLPSTHVLKCTLTQAHTCSHTFTPHTCTTPHTHSLMVTHSHILTHIHICSHMHTQSHRHTHSQRHTQTHTSSDMHTHAHTHSHMLIYAHSYMHTHTLTHMLIQPHTCTYTLICTRTHADMHLHTCTPSHMHTHAQSE